MDKAYKPTLRACYLGFVTQSIVINLLPLFFVLLNEEYGVSLTLLGTLVTVNFCTQLAVDALCIKFINKIGFRRAAVAAHGFAAGGLVLMGVLPLVMPVYAGLTVAVVIYSLGGGLLEVAMSPIVDAIPGEKKASTMSLLHSFYCWGQVAVVAATTLLLLLTGRELWFLLPLGWAALPLYNLFRFLRVPIAVPAGDTQRVPLRKLLGSKIFPLAMLLILCAGAAEQSMSQWASFFVEKVVGLDKAVGDLLGPCLFAVGMGVGRTVFGTVGHKVSLTRALLACAAMNAVSYLMTSLVHHPAVALAGCLLCGLSVSILWPSTLSLASEGYPAGGGAMFALLALCGDVGCAFGPFLSGAVSDLAAGSAAVVRWGEGFGLDAEQAGLKIGLLVSVVFPAMAIFALLRVARLNRLNKNKKDRLCDE